MKRTILVCGLALSLAACAVSAKADVVFSQAPNGSNYTNVAGEYYPTDTFTLSSAATITKVDWYDYVYSGAPDFTITFYANNNGAPGTQIAQDQVTATEIVAGGFADDEYSAPITPLALSANTPYWINIDITPQGSSVWITGSGPGLAIDVSATQKFVTHESLAFTLEDANTPVASTPEPGSVALLGTGMLAGAARWHRRRA